MKGKRETKTFLFSKGRKPPSKAQLEVRRRASAAIWSNKLRRTNYRILCMGAPSMKDLK